MVRRLGIALAALLAAVLTIRASNGLLAAPTPGAEAEIRAVLAMQTEAWNRGDIDGFMMGYWKSDETMFVSAKGVTRGWREVLERYRRAYPDQKAMGRLSFSNLEIHVLCADAAYAIGEFHLQREKDQPSGVFTLSFKKFQEGWRIIADHTTQFPPPGDTKR
jgi:ketosteroid isomerase-like protein